jgi:two-component sensor histidine kinase
MKEIFRPEWNCGRFHQHESKSHALLYNLMDGMAYFFEEESAQIIGAILSYPKNAQIPIQSLIDATSNQFSQEEIIIFCDELISVGLLTEGLLSHHKIKENRRIIGEYRKQQAKQFKNDYHFNKPLQKMNTWIL